MWPFKVRAQQYRMVAGFLLERPGLAPFSSFICVLLLFVLAESGYTVWRNGDEKKNWKKTERN